MSLVSLDHPALARQSRRARPSQRLVSTIRRSVRLLPLTGMLAAATAAARWWRYRQAERALAGADAAMLQDLGIARSDVARIVRGGR